MVADVFEWSRFVDDFVDDGFVDGGFVDGAGDDVSGGSDATTVFWSMSLPFLLGGLGRERFRETIAKTLCTIPP